MLRNMLGGVAVEVENVMVKQLAPGLALRPR